MQRYLALAATACLAVLCLVLAGCNTTTFESVPAGADATCPAEWPGGWIAQDETGHDDASFALFVGPHCELENVTAKTTASAAGAPQPQFFSSGGYRHVVLAGTAVRQLAGDSNDAERIPPDGYFVLRWDFDKPLLTLSSPAHQRIATLIVNGAIDGSVARARNGTLNNVIYGDPAQLKELLQRQDLFAGASPSRLRWTGASRAALLATLQRLRNSEKTTAAAAAAKSKH